MNENLKWIITCFIFAIAFFIMGYIAGLNIPENIEFGLDDKTIEFMEKYLNETESWEQERVIDYNAPFNDSVYGIGGIQR